MDPRLLPFCTQGQQPAMGGSLGLNWLLYFTTPQPQPSVQGPGLDFIVDNMPLTGTYGLLVVDYTASRYLNWNGGTAPSWIPFPTMPLASPSISLALIPVLPGPIGGTAVAHISPGFVASLFTATTNTYMVYSYTTDGATRNGNGFPVSLGNASVLANGS